jgi:uncharacterized protein YkwD
MGELYRRAIGTRVNARASVDYVARMRYAGYNFEAMSYGELLGFGAGSAADAFELWMSIPSLAETIMSPKYHEVAVAVSASGFKWCILFASAVVAF